MDSLFNTINHGWRDEPKELRLHCVFCPYCGGHSTLQPCVCSYKRTATGQGLTTDFRHYACMDCCRDFVIWIPEHPYTI